MTDARSEQRITTTALSPRAVTDPLRAASPQAGSAAVASCSVSLHRAARARSPPLSRSWAGVEPCAERQARCSRFTASKNDTAGDGTPAVPNPQT